MDAVGLVQLGVPGNAVEQKRHEQDAMPPGDVAEGLPKRRGVLLAIVGRRLHAGEDHHHIPSLGALDDLRQVVLHFPD